MAFDLDAPTVFRVGQPTLGVPVMGLEYRGALAPQPETPTEGRLTRLESRVLFLEGVVVGLRQALLDIEFPAPPPPWHQRLARWLRVHWQALWRS
jgi:hypothetical protein